MEVKLGKCNPPQISGNRNVASGKAKLWFSSEYAWTQAKAEGREEDVLQKRPWFWDWGHFSLDALIQGTKKYTYSWPRDLSKMVEAVKSV